MVHTALLARVEFLESQNALLRKQNAEMQSSPNFFRIEQIHQDDKLVFLYRICVVQSVEFLGPVVDRLNYWGSKSKHTRQRTRKLNSMNQLFHFAFRFGMSATQISRYLTTWITFLYQHLVAGTLPSAFRDKFSSTYAIIDGSEIFIETPSDLHMQSSTWSQYKHHNTTKILIACTPNGAICYVSPLYVGSISDVELTRTCVFLKKIEGKPGISIMGPIEVSQ